jgi:hypothetical protein
MRSFILIILLFFISCNSSDNHNTQNLTQITNSYGIVAFVYTNDGKFGLMDTNKNVILPAQFDYIENWQVDNLIRIDSGGKKISAGDAVGYNFKKYGLINTQGKILFQATV